MLHGLLLSKKLINKFSKFIFFYPGNIKQKTGGYIYENNIYEYSKSRNIPIEIEFVTCLSIQYLSLIIRLNHVDLQIESN